MLVESPLDKSGLRAVDACLSEGDLARAQSLLSHAGANPEHEVATTYLATRLLYLRDRLDPERVVQRLRELLARAPAFPEAESLLRLAETGIVGSQSFSALTAACRTLPEGPPLNPPLSSPRPADAEVRKVEVDTRRDSVPRSVSTRPGSSLPPASLRERQSKPAGRYAFGEKHTESNPPRSTGSSAPGKSQSVSVTIPPAPALPRELPDGNSNGPHHRRSSPPPGQRVSVTPDAGRYALSVPPDPQRVSPPPGQQLATGSRASAPPRIPPKPFAVPKPSLPAAAPGALIHNESRGTWTDTLWPDVEKELCAGNHDAASMYLDNAAGDSFLQTGRGPVEALVEEAAKNDFSALATQAASLLTTTYITHHFAPFDQSLSSLARVEWALEVTFGFDSGKPVGADGQALWLLLGAYIGETLVHTHQGLWETGDFVPDAPDACALRVRAGGHVWYPFLIAEQRLRPGGQVPITGNLGPNLAIPGTRPWFAQRPCKRPLPQLWPQAPTAQRISELGVAVSTSVLSAACFQRAGTALDLSEDSLLALDALVDALVDSAVPLTGREPWLQRLAVLVGAYAGEVLRHQVGGDWDLLNSALPSERYVLRLPNGLEVTPAANLVARAVARKGSQLHAYLQTMQRRFGDPALL